MISRLTLCPLVARQLKRWLVSSSAPLRCRTCLRFARYTRSTAVPLYRYIKHERVSERRGSAVLGKQIRFVCLRKAPGLIRPFFSPGLFMEQDGPTWPSFRSLLRHPGAALSWLEPGGCPWTRRGRTWPRIGIQPSAGKRRGKLPPGARPDVC